MYNWTPLNGNNREDVRKHDQLDWKKQQAFGMKNGGDWNV